MTQNAKSTFQDSVTNKNLNSAVLADTASEALLAKKGEDIKLLDVRGLTTLTDFFVICHATTDVQIKALANSVIEKIRELHGETVWRREGMESRRWVILDYVNVVIHIFNREQREFYALEQIWNDANITEITDD